ncbi:DUF58 domain-containing protein [Kovacikia minuta CCNUW1]|uniref:DUF58 domain-containing protein n=1 Tax=Kovacikia minuta TaxID=2931930 RepID=UPI001CCFF0C9|nr:DUF58 domain-containing protein [Kovacikia minuta]UBF26924.1 DUF58 domain-containing protein [Kovacikia minuta CCNUW1]
MLPSRRIYLLLLLGTLAGLGISLVGTDIFNSHFLGLAIALTLVFDGVVLLLAFLDAQWVKPDRVQVTRSPLNRLSIGRDNPVELTVQAGKRPAIVQIRDDYPQAFSVSAPTLAASLPAHQSETLTYTVFPSQRGEYGWGDIYVRQLGTWGLAWHQWKVPQSQTVAVYPDLIGLRSLSIRLTLQTTGNIRRVRQQGMGTEFAELRDYIGGDDPRLVDWKATARRNRVLVRVLEPEQEQTLIVLLDRGRLMTAQVQGLARYDWGLNALLSLALAGLNRGDRVGVGVFDRQMHTWIPPERGQPQLAKLIEQLTPIQPALLEPDYLGAVTRVATYQNRRALVVLITEVLDTTASTDLLSAMGRLAPRHLPFCVTLRDPQVDRQAHTLTTDIPTTYARAVALDLLNQRQLALAKLKQRGVLILDAPANQISDQLVDRYLQLKTRNQL